MSFGKIRVSAFYLLLISGFACNGQGFKGSTATQESDESVRDDADADAGEPGEQVSPPSPIEETIVDVSTTEVPVLACKEKLTYDPSQILCSLRENDKKTIWDNTAVWTDRVASLKNRAASWISPLAALNNGTGNSVYCPFVPDSDRLIFVTNFTLSEDTDITVEAVIDDIGSVRIWKNADAKQEVYASAKAAKVDGALKLTKGFYSVVSDGVDSGKGATGMIMSIFDAKGAVVRQTEALAKDWCIFRVKADTDVAAFVNAASSCRSCLIGSRAGSAP